MRFEVGSSVGFNHRIADKFFSLTIKGFSIGSKSFDASFPRFSNKPLIVVIEIDL